MVATSPSFLDGFKPLAGRAIGSALNRLLALDADTRDALATLEGRRIQMALQAPPLAMEISVRAGRLHVGPADAAREPDLAVRGTLGGVLSQLPFLRPKSGAGIGNVRIAGDADLARQLQKLAAQFDPDWNLPFVAVFGEIVGVQIAQAVRAALRAGRVGASRFAHDAADYLTEESRDVVARAEQEAHFDEVDALRDDVERLHARVHDLRRRVDDAARSGGSKT